MAIPGILWARTRNSERLTRENNTLTIDASAVIIHCLYGQFWGLEGMNNNFGKTVHTGVMDIGFTVFH
jgi:hypothetical protein